MSVLVFVFEISSPKDVGEGSEDTLRILEERPSDMSVAGRVDFFRDLVAVLSTSLEEEVESEITLVTGVSTTGTDRADFGSCFRLLVAFDLSTRALTESGIGRGAVEDFFRVLVAESAGVSKTELESEVEEVAEVSEEVGIKIESTGREEVVSERDADFEGFLRDRVVVGGSVVSEIEGAHSEGGGASVSLLATRSDLSICGFEEAFFRDFVMIGVAGMTASVVAISSAAV